jgi:hypothetical protein
MSDIDRITRLENQVETARRDHQTALNQIYDRLNALAIAIAPNAQNVARLERLEMRILAVEKWQNKVIGIGTLVVILITVFGPAIRKAFNLE